MVRTTLAALVVLLAVSCQSPPPPPCDLSVNDAVQYCRKKCASEAGLLAGLFIAPPFEVTECACIRPNLAPPHLTPRLRL